MLTQCQVQTCKQTCLAHHHHSVMLGQAASVVLNVFLLGAVSGTAWARFGVWIAATLVVFFFYSLPSSYLHSRSRCHSPIYAAERC